MVKALKAHFSGFGELKDLFYGAGKSFCFVTMASSEQCEKVLNHSPHFITWEGKRAPLFLSKASSRGPSSHPIEQQQQQHSDHHSTHATVGESQSHDGGGVTTRGRGSSKYSKQPALSSAPEHSFSFHAKAPLPPSKLSRDTQTIGKPGVFGTVVNPEKKRGVVARGGDSRTNTGGNNDFFSRRATTMEESGAAVSQGSSGESLLSLCFHREEDTGKETKPNLNVFFSPPGGAGPEIGGDAVPSPNFSSSHLSPPGVTQAPGGPPHPKKTSQFVPHSPPFLPGRAAASSTTTTTTTSVAAAAAPKANVSALRTLASGAGDLMTVASSPPLPPLASILQPHVAPPSLLPSAYQSKPQAVLPPGVSPMYDDPPPRLLISPYSSPQHFWNSGGPQISTSGGYYGPTSGILGIGWSGGKVVSSLDVNEGGGVGEGGGGLRTENLTGGEVAVEDGAPTILCPSENTPSTAAAAAPNHKHNHEAVSSSSSSSLERSLRVFVGRIPATCGLPEVKKYFQSFLLKCGVEDGILDCYIVSHEHTQK